MIEFDRVSKRLGGRNILQDIQLQLPSRQTAVLIGPSGSGKSTVLRLMIGLLFPDRGNVRVAGIDVTEGSVLSLRQRLGYVIQDGGLFPHLTASENVALMARHLKWPNEQIERRLRELTHLTQFPSDGLSRFPHELSGGQRQRISLMRSLMLDPEVLLLDEPLGALDPLIRAELQEDLRSIFGELKKTVVLVTHDLAEAAYFGDSITLMRDGRVEQHGPVSALLESPETEFVASFVSAQHRLHRGLLR